MLVHFDVEPPPGTDFAGYTITPTVKGSRVVHFGECWGICVSRAWGRHDGGTDLLIETWGEIPYKEVYVEMTAASIDEATRDIVADMIRGWHVRQLDLAA